jgi:hypothetical protein
MPGYIDGLPVLAGNLVENGATGVDTPKKAIEQMVDGLRIPFFSNEQGDCIADVFKQYDEENPKGELVNFRHELVKACSLSVTSTQLKSMCEQDPGTVTKSDVSTYGVYLNATGIPKKIGVYGNANFSNADTTEWLDIKINTPVGSGTFNGNKLVCNTLITSMNLEFLYANAGAYLNPQPKIVAARVSFGREDIKFIAESNPTTSQSKTMNLVLTTSVSFVHLVNEALEEYVPPAPPLLPEIPYDIFYPFLLSGAQRSVVNVWGALMVTLVSCILAGLR